MQTSPLRTWFLRAFWLVMTAATVALLISRHFEGEMFFTLEGAPRLSDFAVFWAAAKQILQGNALDIYNGAHQVAYESSLLGQQATARMVFPYPPTTLLFIWPLGLIDYLQAWLAFLAIGAGAWFFVLRSITRDSLSALGMTFALGAATYNLQLGQNGFVTAALLCGSIVALPRNRTLAGVLIGLLAFKPHIAVGAFLGLLVLREWKALAVSVGVVVILAALSTLVFGWQIWPAFLAGDAGFATGAAREIASGPSFLQQSVFSVLAPRFGVGIALAAHFLFAGAVFLLAAQFKDWKQRRPALIVATFLLAPFSFLYDATALTGAAALLLRNARSGAEAVGICAGAALPALWFVTASPFAVIGALALLAITLRQSLAEKRDRASDWT